jgi:hypothetical protein
MWQLRVPPYLSNLEWPQTPLHSLHKGLSAFHSPPFTSAAVDFRRLWRSNLRQYFAQAFQTTHCTHKTVLSEKEKIGTPEAGCKLT